MDLSTSLISAAQTYLGEPFEVLRFYDRTSTAGSVVLICQKHDGTRLVFKHGLMAGDEFEGYQRSQGLYPDHVPQVEWIDGKMPFMIYSYIDGPCFSQVVFDGSISRERILKIHRDRLEKKGRVWVSDCRSYDPKIMRSGYLRKARDSVAHLLRMEINGVSLAKVSQLPLVIGERDYPSLQTLAEVMTSLRSLPSKLVLDHIDSHGDNIIIGPADQWYLIDWQLVDWFTWMEAVVREALWWRTEYAAAPWSTIEVRDGRLRLNYQLILPPICYELEEMSLNLSEAMAAKEDPGWQRNFAIVRAIQFIRRMIHHPVYYSPPRHLEIALLGELIKTLADFV